MAKSKETLIKEIEAEAKKQGTPAPVTEGLGAEKLADLLKTMKDAAASAKDDEDDVVEPAKVKRPPYYICDGQSLTTLKGILGPGDEVKEEYLIDGKDGLNRHRKNGVIAKA